MRQTCSLWFYLGFWKNWAGHGKSKWRFPDFLKQRMWTSEYFIQDTFITPFFKLIGCKLIGHKTLFSDSGDEYGPGKRCIRCDTYPIRTKINKLALYKMPLYINDLDKYVREVAIERLKKSV